MVLLRGASVGLVCLTNLSVPGYPSFLRGLWERLCISPTFSGHIIHVVLVSSLLKVVWVYARRVVAVMTYMQSIWNRASAFQIRRTMGKHRRAVIPRCSITGIVFRPLPLPTTHLWSIGFVKELGIVGSNLTVTNAGLRAEIAGRSGNLPPELLEPLTTMLTNYAYPVHYLSPRYSLGICLCSCRMFIVLIVFCGNWFSRK